MAIVINGSTGIDKVQDDSVDIADLSATGSPSSSTYLRGDNTWATAGGATSLNGLSDCTVTADDNIGIGSTAVDSITTGDQNVGVGVYALTGTTTGANNSGFGHQALYANTTGSELLILYAYIPALLVVAFLILHIYVLYTYNFFLRCFLVLPPFIFGFLS